MREKNPQKNNIRGTKKPYAHKTRCSFSRLSLNQLLIYVHLYLSLTFLNTEIIHKDLPESERRELVPTSTICHLP